SQWFKDQSKVRLHLIGHSAGAIVHSYIVNRLKWNFETVNFMAPAVRADIFKANVVPAMKTGRVKQYNHFELTDEMELKDPTCKPILGYSRSLLYLVSQSFEKGQVTPILGMEKFFASEIGSLGLNNINVFKSPGAAAKSTTHGGFDDDDVTRNKILSLIKS
ncbi:MAG TPA: peptidase C1A papain, partial [Edaphobacter sp.]